MPLPIRKQIRLHPSAYRSHGRVFSVTICTSPRQPIFDDSDLGLACITLLRELCGSSHNPLLAYCLMPDHVHLLIEIRGKPLPAFVRAWKSRCYHERRRRGHTRPFWQRGYFDHALRASEDLVGTARYIIANPVRAGLVTDSGDYALCGSLVWEL